MFDFIFGNTATVAGTTLTKEIVDAYAEARATLHGIKDETDPDIGNIEINDSAILSEMKKIVGDSTFNAVVVDNIIDCMKNRVGNTRTNVTDHIIHMNDGTEVANSEAKTFNTVAELCCAYENIISKNQCVSESMRTDDFNLIWEYYKLGDRNIAIVRNIDPSLVIEPTQPISVYRGWLIITNKSDSAVVYELYDCNTRTVIIYSTTGELPEKLSHYNYDAVVLNNEPRNPLSMFEEEPLGEIVLSHQVQVSPQSQIEHEEHTVGEIMAAANGNRRKAKS